MRYGGGRVVLLVVAAAVAGGACRGPRAGAPPGAGVDSARAVALALAEVRAVFGEYGAGPYPLRPTRVTRGAAGYLVDLGPDNPNVTGGGFRVCVTREGEATIIGLPQ